jgi:hypothetical protein
MMNLHHTCAPHRLTQVCVLMGFAMIPVVHAAPSLFCYRGSRGVPFPVTSSLPGLEGDDRAQTWYERFVLQRNRTMLGPIYTPSVSPSEDLRTRCGISGHRSSVRSIRLRLSTSISLACEKTTIDKQTGASLTPRSASPLPQQRNAKKQRSPHPG